MLKRKAFSKNIWPFNTKTRPVTTVKSTKFFTKLTNMVFSKDFKFPSDAELTVEECPLGTPYLKAGAQHLGKYCEAQNNEFVLCRHETRDPIKCLPEGKVVTACTNEFFRKVI